jgi:hypothetical protein
MTSIHSSSYVLHPPLILRPPTYPPSGPWLDAFVLFHPLSVPLSDMFLSSPPISRRTSGFSSHARDMFLDEFPQSGYHVRTFPRFYGRPLGTSLELPYLRSSTGLRLNSLSISGRLSGLVPAVRILCPDFPALCWKSIGHFTRVALPSEFY